MFNRLVIALAIATGLLISLPTLAGTKAKPALQPSATTAFDITKPSVAEPGTIRVLLAAARETILVSPIAAEIATVNTSLGASFKKGKILVRLRCRVQNARLRISMAELTSTKVNYQSKAQLQELKQAGQVEVALAESAVARAQAQVHLHQVEVSQCNIKAPFSGRTAKVAVKSYQGVSQSQPLLEIVAEGALKVRLNAPAKWVGWLRKGVVFNILVDETGKRYTAKVTAINARIDTVSQTIELEGKITEHAADLLPGMSGTAVFSPINGET